MRHPLPDHERVSQFGRVLTAPDLSLRTRVAAAIVLLYAQPISRIVRLTLDDVIRDGDQVLLRLGEPPSPVPAPVADLLLSWIGSRNNINTATNRHPPWLFPGRRVGQPMRSDYLAALVRDIGIPTTAGRASAIRQHVLEMPAPVVADALGYHPVTTAKLAAQAAGTWSRYAPPEITCGRHLAGPPGVRPEDHGRDAGRTQDWGRRSRSPSAPSRLERAAISANLDSRGSRLTRRLRGLRIVDQGR